MEKEKELPEKENPFWLKRFEIHYLYVFLFSPLDLTDGEGELFQKLSTSYLRRFREANPTAGDIRIGDLLAYAIRENNSQEKDDVYRSFQFHMGEELEPPHLRIDIYTKWPHFSIDLCKEKVDIRLIQIDEEGKQAIVEGVHIPAHLSYHIALFEQGLGAMDITLSFDETSLACLYDIAVKYPDADNQKGDETHRQKHSLFNYLIKIMNLGRFYRPWNCCEVRDTVAQTYQGKQMFGVKGDIELTVKRFFPEEADYYNGMTTQPPDISKIGERYRKGFVIAHKCEKTADCPNRDSCSEVSENEFICSLHCIFERGVRSLLRRINTVATNVGYPKRSKAGNKPKQLIEWDIMADRANKADIYNPEKSLYGSLNHFQEPFVALVCGADTKAFERLRTLIISGDRIPLDGNIDQKTKVDEQLNMLIDVICLLERYENHRNIDLTHYLKYENLFEEILPGQWALTNMYPRRKFFTHFHRESLVLLYPLDVFQSDEILELRYYLRGLFRLLEGLRGKWYMYIEKNKSYETVLKELSWIVRTFIHSGLGNKDNKLVEALHDVSRTTIEANADILSLLSFEDPLTYGTAISPFSRIYEAGTRLLKLNELKTSVEKRVDEIEKLYALIAKYINTAELVELWKK